MVGFPYYSGNIYKSEAIGLISLEKFILAHKSPTDITKETILKINDARIRGDIKEKRELKMTLHTFTPSVIINKGDARKYENIKEFTGLMQIDLDGIPTKQKAIDLKEHIFHFYEEIVCSYISPSMQGVKALMRIKKPTDIKSFKAIHKAVEEEFNQYEYFDKATKNAILPLFLSYDPAILYREFEDAIVWDEEDWSKTEYVSLNEAPKPRNTEDKDSVYYYNKVVDIITRRINEIVDNGHPQVRNTSLVLGSRVGAGYITHSEAEHLIESLIKSNSYLQKGISGYVKTAYWGINQGITNPKYF